MLLADKRDLQNSLKLSLLQIEEKELNFYTTNCHTVGTQAALLAGFGFAALIESRSGNESFTTGMYETMDSNGNILRAPVEAHIVPLRVTWFCVTVIAMCLEIFAVVKAMQLSILGPGLALRGPEGSMTRALVVMRVEYKKVHNLFYAGLGFFLASVGLYTWAMFSHVLGRALAITVVLLVVGSAIWMVRDNRVIWHKLKLPQQSRESRWEPRSSNAQQPNAPARDAAGGGSISISDALARRRPMIAPLLRAARAFRRPPQGTLGSPAPGSPDLHAVSQRSYPSMQQAAPGSKVGSRSDQLPRRSVDSTPPSMPLPRATLASRRSSDPGSSRAAGGGASGRPSRNGQPAEGWSDGFMEAMSWPFRALDAPVQGPQSGPGPSGTRMASMSQGQQYATPASRVPVTTPNQGSRP